MSWIEDLWRSVIEETIDQAFREPEWAEYPALGRLTITRPELLKPFNEHNRLFPDQAVRPHSFVSVAYQKPFARAEKLRLFAPFVSPADALEVPWYELRSGEQVRITTENLRGAVVVALVPVRTYGEIACAYRARPESKFLDAEGGPCLASSLGTLVRRRLENDQAEYIGKEGSLLQRRVEGSGVAAEVQQVYSDPADFRRYVVPVLRQMDKGLLADIAGVTPRALRDILHERRLPTPSRREVLIRAAALEIRRSADS